MTASSNNSAPQFAKQVSFALEESVEYIRPGDGTWENGEPRARRPSTWEMDNSERLTEKAFSDIERMEQSEKIKRQTRRKPVPAQSRFNEDDPSLQAWPKAGHLARKVTFDDFLTKDQLANDEPEVKKSRRTASMKTLASSLASVKSLTKAFKRKMQLKNRHQS